MFQLIPQVHSFHPGFDILTKASHPSIYLIYPAKYRNIRICIQIK